MFIVRPHPADSAELYASTKQTNVRLFDEMCGILADSSLGRVMPNVDYLLTSPSTMILDGAVCSIPTYVYSTGQPNELDGVAPAPLSGFKHVLSGRDDLVRTSEQFKARYGEAIDADFYSRFSTLLDRKSSTENPDFATAAIASLAVQAVGALRNQTSVQAHVQALEAKLAALQDIIDTSGGLEASRNELKPERDIDAEFSAKVSDLEDKLASLEVENKKMILSRSWRFTSPMRRGFRLIAKLRHSLEHMRRPQGD
jgi:hypothetical protein